MNKSTISLKTLFLIFFKINLVTFGGGYTIVPVIMDEFSKKQKLINEDEMVDIVAIAQSGPGPMAINTSLLTGYRISGMKGALTCLIASILPCLIIISLLYYFYSNVIHLKLVKIILDCMSGAMSAILFFTVYKMAKKTLKNHTLFGIVLMLFSFLIGYFTNINTVLIILFAGIIGLSVFSIFKEEKIC